jgi:riboflavin kinase/FMN adenylyltransferase
MAMQVIYDTKNFKPQKPVVLTTGTFDGVHLGHRVIIDRITSLARQINGVSVLLSFSPHPRKVLFPDKKDLKLLSTEEEKIALLSKTGLDYLILHPFTKTFANTTAKDYVEQLLVNTIGVSKYVIGYDHQFGKNREGSFENLKNMGPKYGFEVEEIPVQEIDSVNVSSTKIRKALTEGNIEIANKFLGNLYSFSGTVVKGKSLGRTLGFPTANLRLNQEDKLIPATGVYAVKVNINGELYNGMMNLGFNPTVQPLAEPIPEIHIFDFNKDIYHTNIQVLLVKKIRNEQKFDSVEQLQNQIQQDKIEAKKIHSAHPN